MRIDRIWADGLLSFEEFELALDTPLTVIVGPNGSGKTNVLRLLRAIGVGLDAAGGVGGAGQQRLDQLVGERAPGRACSIRAHLLLDQTAERELLVALFKAAIYGSFVGLNYGPDWSPIEAWIRSEVTEASITELFEMDVALSHDGTPSGIWQCWLEFRAERGDGSTDTFSVPLLGAGLRNNILSGVERRDSASTPSLRDRLMGSSAADATPPQGRFTLSRVLPATSEGTTVTVALRGRNPIPPLYEDFAALLGISLVDDSGSDAGFDSVLRRILADSLFVETDARLTTAIADRTETSARLLRLKNGGSSRSLRFRAIAGRFRAFTQGRDLDVILAADGESHSVWVSARRDPDLTASFDQIPIEFAGSGAWEALTLAERLTALTGSLVGFDEPGVSWHPNLQRHFLTDLKDSDAQVILVTHSPYMIPIDAEMPGYRLVRLVLEEGVTRAHVADPALMGAIVPKLRQTGNERVVFAAAAILCEGKDDQAAVRVVADHEAVDLDALNITVVDCASRDNIPDYVRLCAALGIRALAIQDSDASKEDVSTRRNVQRVQDAVQDAPCVDLVEFVENIEEAVGSAKNTEAICAAVKGILETGSGNADLTALRIAIQKLRRSLEFGSEPGEASGATSEVDASG